MITIHLPAIFHTICSQEFSHCAFTGKVLRFPKMMHMVDGYRVIEYGTEGSESEADEHVSLMSRDQRLALLDPIDGNTHLGAQAIINSPIHKAFEGGLWHALHERVKPGDIIAHPFGRSHMKLVDHFPQAHHVETGIGYPDRPFGAWRIFESEAWRHHHWGMHRDETPRARGDNRLFSWVIPNYYDIDLWPLGRGLGMESRSKYSVAPPQGPRPYALFMGRFTEIKGIHTIRQIIDGYYSRPADPLDFRFAGIGDWDSYIETIPEELRQYCHYHGNVTGTARASLVANARVMLAPSNFIEPFCGSAVESMLCGTPVLAPDFGAFTETVQDGITGFRCKTLGDWIAGLHLVTKVDRRVCRRTARDRYSLETCAEAYDRAFRQIKSLEAGGWKDLECRNPTLREWLKVWPTEES